MTNPWSHPSPSSISAWMEYPHSSQFRFECRHRIEFNFSSITKRQCRSSESAPNVEASASRCHGNSCFSSEGFDLDNRISSNASWDAGKRRMMMYIIRMMQCQMITGNSSFWVIDLSKIFEIHFIMNLKNG